MSTPSPSAASTERFGRPPTRAIAWLSGLMVVAVAAWAVATGWYGHSVQSPSGPVELRVPAMIIIVLAQVQLLAVLWRWHQDQRLLRRLRDDRGTPISVHSATADVSVAILVWSAVTLTMGAFTFVAAPARYGWIFYPFAAIFTLLSIGGFCAVFPRHGLLIQVFGSGIRLVAEGQVQDLAWTDLRYACEVDPEYGATIYLLRTPGIRRLELPSGLTRFDDLVSTLATSSPEPERVRSGLRAALG